MARLASSDKQSFSPSYGTSYQTETLTLIEAFSRVVDGRMSPVEVYAQLPTEIRRLFDEAAHAACEKAFSALSTHEQKQIIAAFLAASLRPTPPAETVVRKQEPIIAGSLAASPRPASPVEPAAKKQKEMSPITPEASPRPAPPHQTVVRSKWWQFWRTA